MVSTLIEPSLSETFGGYIVTVLDDGENVGSVHYFRTREDAEEYADMVQDLDGPGDVWLDAMTDEEVLVMADYFENRCF